MDRSQLARLEHENLIESLSLAGANVEGGLVRHADGVVLLATGLPMRLFNQVIVSSDEAAADSVADAVVTIRTRSDRFVVNLRVGADDRLIPLMGQLGLERLSDQPWMPGLALQPLSPDARPAPGPDHAIRRITEPGLVEDHIQTAAAGFEMLESYLRAIMLPTMATRPGDGIDL